MNRQVFANRALSMDGKPIYDVLFHNKAQDPEEVSKSKRYTLERTATQTSNVTDDTLHRDFASLIERDWEYGKKAFVVTYGMVVSKNLDSNKQKIQFAGYWL